MRKTLVARSGVRLAVAAGVTIWLSGAANAQDAPKTPSKVASYIEQMVDHCAEMVAVGDDPSQATSALVAVGSAGELELLIHAAGAVGDAEEGELRALGATIVKRLDTTALGLDATGMIQAWVPFDAVDRAAALPWVVAVTPPDYGEPDNHPVNPIDSEGVALHNADTAHAQGVTGTGVVVGAISDGVTNLAAAQAQNELPAVNVLAVGAGDEGTAMLEIIHDMAPGAGLMFSATGGGVVNHVTSMMNLVAGGANVIAEDIAFDAEPAFQQGVAAQTAEMIAAGGVSLHSSAGNRGANHAARVAAIGTGGGPDGQAGPFAGCPAINNVVAIAPGGDTTFDVVLGTNTRITLQWSEPRAVFPTAGQGGFTDLDLFVMDAGLTTCLASSVGAQALGVGDTIEQVLITAPGTAAKIVVNVSGGAGAAAPPILDLRWRRTQAQTDAPTRAGSLNPDSNYVGLATSAAAIRATSGAIENFSSGGPVSLGLTTLWVGGGMAGVPGPGPANTPGPDWAAADGNAVSGVGGFGSGVCPAVNPGDCRFFGTSASAPHAAGCDALVREILGAASPVAPVNAQLVNTATDVAPAGPDNITGAGLLDCFEALDPPMALCQDVTVPTAPGVCQAGASIDNGSFDPDGGALSLAQVPPGDYALGVTAVELTVTDDEGLTDSCSANVTVEDDEPPVVACNAPATITPPDAPISFTASAMDNCGVSSVEITAFDCFKFTKKGKRIDKTFSCEIAIDGDTITVFDSGGVDDHITWTVAVDDGSGNTTQQQCETLVVKP